MKATKAEKREQKRFKRQYGHTEDGGSVKLIVRIQIERAEKIKKGGK